MVRNPFAALFRARDKPKDAVSGAPSFFFGSSGAGKSVTVQTAIGGASVTVPAYLAEMSPSDRRGRMVTQNELMIVTGQLCAFVLNAIMGVVFGSTAHIWRYMLAIASLPAIVLWFGMLVMPESPRWLVLQGRIGDAMEVLKKIRDEKQAVAEFNEIQDNLARLSSSPWALPSASRFPASIPSCTTAPRFSRKPASPPRLP